MLFWDRVFLCNSFCSGNWYVAQAGLRLMVIILPQLPKCRDYKCVPGYPTRFLISDVNNIAQSPRKCVTNMQITTMPLLTKLQNIQPEMLGWLSGTDGCLYSSTTRLEPDQQNRHREATRVMLNPAPLRLCVRFHVLLTPRNIIAWPKVIQALHIKITRSGQ